MRLCEFDNRLLVEAFDTTANWQEYTFGPKEIIYGATIAGDEIDLSFTTDRGWNHDVTIDFTRNGDYSQTGEGSQMQIFGAILNKIFSFAKQYNPARVIFSATKIDKDRDSRTKLYRSLINRYATKLGYKLKIINTPLDEKYVLQKKNDIKEQISAESGKEMLKIFRNMHHDVGMNKDMDRFILSHNWELRNFTPDMFPSEEEFFDYDDPFDRIIDIDYSRRVDLSQPIIVGPQYSDGKYSVIDGNHRAAQAQTLGKTIKGYFPVKKVNETGMIFARKPVRGGVKQTQKFACTSGPRAGKRVSNISQCFAPIDVSKKIQMTKTRARTAERQARKARRTKRIDPSSLLAKVLNRSRRPSKPKN